MLAASWKYVRIVGEIKPRRPLKNLEPAGALIKMDEMYREMPIDSAKRQMRVLTIRKERERGGPLSCHMRIVSLLDIIQGYEDAFYAQEVSQKTLVGSFGGDQYEGPTDVCPGPRTHRFVWGDYAALSYVWGDPSKTAKVLVNGVQFTIRANLSEALCALRATGRFHQRFHLWVDALCINQKNHEERNHQVAMMRVFYAKAWFVIGYLGVEANHSDEAIDLILALAKQSRNPEKRPQLQRQSVYEGVQHYPKASWMALESLLLRPYWERLWITQELALGGSRVMLCCGSKWFRWQEFCRGVGGIHVLDPIEYRFKDVNRPLFHIWKDLWMLTRAQELQSNAPKLSRLLEIADSCHCMDPRDKIYGLLGVMDPKLADAISPDYTYTAAEVFTNFVEAYMATYSDLEFLRDANIGAIQGAPSWVPNWAWSGRCRDSKPDGGFVPDDPIDAAMEMKPYSADAGLEFRSPKHNEGRLELLAAFVDQVDGLGSNAEASHALPIHTSNSSSNYGGYQETADELAIALYAGRRRWAGSHSRALLHLPVSMEEGHRQFTQAGWTRFTDDVVRYFKRWVAWYKANEFLMVGGRPLNAYFSGMLHKGAEEEDFWTAYVGWRRTALAGVRRLVTTRSGRIGWVSCSPSTRPDVEVRKGDVFAIVPGCSMPILLRLSDHPCTFSVVGEAYLHGVMEGEVAAFVDQKIYSLQKIWLC